MVMNETFFVKNDFCLNENTLAFRIFVEEKITKWKLNFNSPADFFLFSYDKTKQTM
jgi:hypothetical protein